MMTDYAKVIVPGSPISKSNFKLWNKNGRAILPSNSGQYHDRYSNYEDIIALNARNQCPGIVFDTSLIAVLKVFYKSDKRHPDTNNITKSIFDGIEKSGLIVNDAQIRRLIIEEYYDKVNPRFELELFAESAFRMSYTVRRHGEDVPVISYEPISNKKISLKRTSDDPDEKVIRSVKGQVKEDTVNASAGLKCSICGKPINSNDYISADNNKTKICRKCFSRLF